MVFSAHPWFTTHALEEEQGDVCLSARAIPLSVRMTWLKRLRHTKVQFLFSGSGRLEVEVGPNDGVGILNDNFSSSSSSSSRPPPSQLEMYDIYASKHESSRRPFPKGLIIPPPPPPTSHGNEKEGTSPGDGDGEREEESHTRERKEKKRECRTTENDKQEEEEDGDDDCSNSDSAEQEKDDEDVSRALSRF